MTALVVVQYGEQSICTVQGSPSVHATSYSSSFEKAILLFTLNTVSGVILALKP